MPATHRALRCRPARGRGFSLLETLIALVVFSLGILGLAALQGLSKKTNFEAIERTQAAFLANDIIERMRANPGALNSYDADGDDAWLTVGGGSRGDGPQSRCRDAACDGPDLARDDLWAWEQAIDGAAARNGDAYAGGLAAPTGCIRRGADGQVEVAIAWRGLTALSNAGAATACTAAGRYGSGDAHRRVLTMNTYIQG